MPLVKHGKSGIYRLQYCCRKILLRTSVDTSEPLSRPVGPGDRRVLVTGGTGFIGSHLVAALVGQGFNPRALVRPTSDIAQLSALGIEYFVGGLDDPDVLDASCEWCRVG